jgi:hypothetical protein
VHTASSAAATPPSLTSASRILMPRPISRRHQARSWRIRRRPKNQSISSPACSAVDTSRRWSSPRTECGHRRRQLPPNISPNFSLANGPYVQPELPIRTGRLSIAIAGGMTMCLRGQRDHGMRLRNYTRSRRGSDAGLPLHNL